MYGFCSGNSRAAFEEHQQWLHLFYLQRPYRVVPFVISSSHDVVPPTAASNMRNVWPDSFFFFFCGGGGGGVVVVITREEEVRVVGVRVRGVYQSGG
jgi:hypothetical protein